MVASSSAGFLSSMTPRGRPLTNSTTSGRRVFLFSATVSWLTASQSLRSGLSKSIDPRLRPAHGPAGRPMLHRDAVDEHAMEGAVAGLQRRPLRASQPAQGVVQCVGGQVRVELGECVPQPPLQHHLPVVAAFRVRRIRRDVRPVGSPPADALQPRQSGLFNVCFGNDGHATTIITF